MPHGYRSGSESYGQKRLRSTSQEILLFGGDGLCLEVSGGIQALSSKSLCPQPEIQMGWDLGFRAELPTHGLEDEKTYPQKPETLNPLPSTLHSKTPVNLQPKRRQTKQPRSG